MKSKFLLLFASIFVIFSFVGGTICLNADTLFSTSTEVVQQDETNESDDETKIQATGSWSSSSNYGSSTRLTGSGTSSSPYQISTANQLAYYMYLVNNSSAYRSTYVELTANIDLSEHYWTPIGQGKNVWSGHFDGNGYSITGLTLSITSLTGFSLYESSYTFGLFGAVSNATIENFILREGNIALTNGSLTSTTSKYTYHVGTVAGIDAGGSSFENIINEGVSITISYSSSNRSNWFNDARIGGIVGTSASSSTFENCFNYADITSGYETGNITIGGILGYAKEDVNLSGCANLGDITGNVRNYNGYGYGGIVGVIGFTSGNHSIVEDCVNYGDVIVTNKLAKSTMYLGGIIGWGIQSVYLNRCINYGSIQGSSYIGGIAGRMGSSQKSVSFLGTSYSQNSPLENVLIANCINYGTFKSASGLINGHIAGEVNGENVVRSCYVNTTGKTVGTWNDKGNSEDEIYAVTNYDIYKSTFFRTPANSTMTSHDGNFNGSKDGLNFTGWDRITVGLNGDNGSGQWVLTTLLYNEDYTNGLNEDYPYSMAPATLIGTVNFKVQYRESRSTSEYYDIEKSARVPTANFDLIVGTTAQEINLRRYDYESFYDVPSGYSQIYYLKDNPEFNVNLVYFMTDDVLFEGDFIEDPRYNLPPSYSSTGAHVIFDAGVVSSSTPQKIILRCRIASYPPQIFYYKIGSLEKGKEGKYSAKVSFGSDYTTGNLDRDNYSDEYLTIIDEIPEGGYYEQGHYFHEEVNLTITPAPGYAVLYTQYSSSEPSSYDESLNLNPDVAPVEVKFENSNYIETIEPSCYGDVSLSYNFNYNYLYIYLVPVEYDLEIVCGDGEEITTATSYVFQDGERGGGTSNIEKEASFYKNTRGKLNNDDLLQVPFKNFLEEGYGYSIYASTTDDIYTDYEDKERVSLNMATNKLSENQDLRFGLLNMLLTALQNGTVKGKTIYVLVVKGGIEYSVNFVHMVNSYSNPDYFQDRTAEGIGGETFTSDALFKSGDDFGYFISPNYGYEHVGFSFSKHSSLNSNIQTSFYGLKTASYSATSSYRESKDDGAPTFSYKYTSFDTLLNGFLDYADEQGFDGDDAENITIYVYFELQGYVIGSVGIVYSSNSTTYDASVISFDMENGVDVTENPSYTDWALKRTYYFTPVSLSASEIDGAKFIGWFLYSNTVEEMDEFLSNLNDYNFLVNPNVSKPNRFSSTAPSLRVAAVYVSCYDDAPLTVKGDNLIEISSAQDLFRLSTSVNSGNTYEGYVIRQTADIDMRGYRYFVPIGTEENPFKGTYDGQNHNIINLPLDAWYYRYAEEVGMFGYVEDATIMNLTLKDSNFLSFGYAGIIAGKAYDSHFYNLRNYNCDFSYRTFSSISDEPAYKYTIYGFPIYKAGYTSSSYNTMVRRFNCANDYVLIPYSESNRTEVYMSTGVPTELQLEGIEDWYSYSNISYPSKSFVFAENSSIYYSCEHGYIGGLIGFMDGGSVKVCYVDAYLKFSISYYHFFGYLIGFAEGNITIDQCAYENLSDIFLSNYLGSRFNIVSDLSLSYENGVKVTDCYVRSKYGSIYYNMTRTTGVYNSSYDLNEHNLREYQRTRSIISGDTSLWFQLPNGYWTLKVFYWT